MFMVIDAVCVTVVTCWCKSFDLCETGNVGSPPKNLTAVSECVEVPMVSYLVTFVRFVGFGWIKSLVVRSTEVVGTKGYCDGDVVALEWYVSASANYGCVIGVMSRWAVEWATEVACECPGTVSEFELWTARVW